MIKGWKIEASPAPGDPERRLLLLKGAKADVQGLILRLGAVCGRPKREKQNRDFNFRIFLHRVGEADLGEIEDELKTLSGVDGITEANEPEPESKPEPAPAAAEGPAITLSLPGEAASPAAADAGPMPASSGLPEGGAAPAPEAAAPAPEAAAPAPEAAAPGPFSAFTIPANTPPAVAPEAEQPPPAVEAAAEEPAEELGPFAKFGKVSKAAPAPAPAARAAAPPAGEKKPEPEPAKPVPSGFVAQAGQPLFGAVMGRVPGFKLDNLLVGGAARFAHAGAMSVVENPGKMYNPFFLHGGAGLGKTHLVHAVANKFSENFPDKPVWITSGPRLARAAALAGAAGRGADLTAFAEKASCLLIDDIHLLGVSDGNRELLENILKVFFGGPKQVVMTSSYPHKLLGALEEALKFRIAGGHPVELKPPAEKLRKKIVAQALGNGGLAGDEAATERFAAGLAGDFSGLEAAIRRTVSLRATLTGAGKEVALKDLIDAVFAPDTVEPSPVSEEDVKKALGAASPLPAEGSIATILLFPNLQEAHADWIWSNLAGTAAKNGWPFPFRLSARKAYAIDQVFATPFIVAEECHGAGASAALALGPPPGSELSEHEAEFRYVADHLTRDAGIGLGWISYNRVMDPKYAALAYLDMLRARAFETVTAGAS